MTARNEQNYDLAILRTMFFVAQNEHADWRLFHTKNGRVADNSLVKGRRIIHVRLNDGRYRLLQAHCVIWMLVNDRSLPIGQPIDHKNRNCNDNNPDNLRAATHQSNAVNRDASDGGLIGIFENRKIAIGKKRWQAVAHDPKTNRRISLKCHATPEDAARAYDSFVLSVHGANAVTNASLGRFGMRP